MKNQGESLIHATEKSVTEHGDKVPAETKDKVTIQAAEDGSGVGAALIAALTLKRAKEGNLAGIRDMEDMKQLIS